MKRKLLMPGIAGCIASSLLVYGVLADHEKGKNSDTRTDISQCPMMKLSQAQGARVQDRQGNQVGTIQEVVADPESGRIHFAILSLADAAGKSTAVPWRLLRPETPNAFVLQADREQLRTASTFTQDQWPDLSQWDVANRFYTHYGLSYDRPGVGGRVSLPEGVEYGTEVYYDESATCVFPRPQPDGHSTFPYLGRTDKDR